LIRHLREDDRSDQPKEDEYWVCQLRLRIESGRISFLTGKKTADDADSMNATGELFMVSKKERILIKTVLTMVLNSKTGREFITRRFGAEYVKIGKKLLEDIG
jgi:hypothetical protein